MPRYTPENIRTLAEGEIFVFGSNLQGAHGGGAARVAVKNFGAIMGQGVGLQGRSYAIPTMQGGVETIRPYTDQFIQFAKQHPELTFLVTRIGCGIAGFRDEEIAPLFRDALNVENIILPKSFVPNYIELNEACPGDIRCMGAICGDVIGSIYEFHPVKTKEFQLFTDNSRPTDDSVMTLAVMQWLTNPDLYPLIPTMHHIGNMYPMAGYGGRFFKWIINRRTQPYNSYGNGSAMRVSPAAWAAGSLEEALKFARQSAETTHNNPEGVKGAQAAVAAVFGAKNGKSKQEIKRYIEQTFGYNLSRTLDEIRPTYRFDVTCQGSVPESIICFLESTDYVDAIRNAVSLGGDADTMAAIAGAIAEAYYGGVPDEVLAQVWGRLDDTMRHILLAFHEKIH